MSIQPPSDLILDVINAADPKKAQAMATRLQQASLATSAPAVSEAFGDELRQAGLPLDQMSLISAPSSMALRNATALSQKAGSGGTGEAYRRFEAMVLSNFVESMLPTKASTVFGSGTAGNVWRSMLSERIASEVAKAGGIGLAGRMASSGPNGAPQAAAPTPPASTSRAL